jgi:Pyridoxamine 5'-phosphate oxidase
VIRPLLELARELGARESGLAVAVTSRLDGSPQASVVNAGLLEHPITGELAIGFVARGGGRKLANVRARPRATVVFRSGWDWVAVEGEADLVGPTTSSPGGSPPTSVDCCGRSTPQPWEDPKRTGLLSTM